MLRTSLDPSKRNISTQFSQKIKQQPLDETFINSSCLKLPAFPPPFSVSVLILAASYALFLSLLQKRLYSLHQKLGIIGFGKNVHRAMLQDFRDFLRRFVVEYDKDYDLGKQ
jgi:hypothetical protein